MLQGRDFYKVLDENTILIAPDQRQKRQEYEDRVIKTFFLSNGDTKQVNTVLRQLLDARKVAENPELNSITIKDSPDVVAVAQKIIEANDKAKAELVIDVELVELNRSKTRDLGIDLSSKGFSISFTGGDSLPLNNLTPLRSDGNWSIGPIPSFVFTFAKTLTDAKVIAKPQLRVTDGEKAEIHIGDRVPIPSTTFNTSNTIGGNIVPVTSFTYQNVGIEISVEPRVHHNREITLKLNVKISSLSGSVEGTGGVSQPIIGERQITTVVRLKDGETNLLSGLIREEDRHSLAGIPGLSDIPILNRLFGKNSDTTQKTDIVLTLTPHIVRVPDIRDADLDSIWVGTEEQIKLRVPNRNPFGESPFAGADDEDASTQAPAEGNAAPIAPKDTGAQAPLSATPVRPPAAESAPPTPPPAQVEADDEDFEDDEFDDEEDYEEEDSEGDSTQQAPTLAQIILTTPKSIYQIGEQVIVQVRVANATNVGSIPFHLRYNQAALEYTSQASEGDFLNRDGASTVFVPTAVGPGEIVVGASRVSSPAGANGAGILGTFTFIARAAGPANFTFTGAAVKDPNANNLPASFSAAQVVVQPR
jgi:general secretion pathway protein D